MSWDLKLGEETNDLQIAGGTFRRVTGSDQVRQRLRTAIWHYFGEYFLNTGNGVPWYENILGRTRESGEVDAILRRKILSVPGVIRIETFTATFNRITRSYRVDTDVQVESGPGDPPASIQVDLNLIQEGP